MANNKPEETRRKPIPVMLTPENIAYLDEKGKLFARGKRGGRSEALNRIIEFTRKYEEENG